MKSARPHSTTIAEVARVADVSPATVSRVMNNHFLGEPEIAERVRRVAAELNYSPSPLARSLALGKTHSIAFVVPDLANPAFQVMLSSLSKASAGEGYRVLVADSNEDPDEEPLLALETRRRCDSIVLCAPRMPEERLRSLLPELQPVVLINRTDPGFEAPSLSIDYGAGIQQLAQHLHGLGHRRFVYLEGPTTSASNTQRVEGLKAFAGRAEGVRIDYVRGGVTSEDGFGSAVAIAQTGASAVLAFNDLVAIGLINGLAELGLSVPRDISVAGFDDIPLARYVAPSLTTASVPFEPLGTEAWRRLRSLIQGETPDHNLVFQPRAELRGSTGPVLARVR